MTSAASTKGRPRSFDEDETLDRVVEIFWRHGATGATTRVLEAELGLTQSSIYNAFGSKNELMMRAIERYNRRLDETVVVPLDSDTAVSEHLYRFIDAVMDWIGDPDHPGCLLLNTLGQLGASDPAVVEQAQAYRNRVRTVLTRVLGNAGVTDADRRAELLLGGLMGLNISAYGGADRAELDSMAESLRAQIGEWLEAA